MKKIVNFIITALIVITTLGSASYLGALLNSRGEFSEIFWLIAICIIILGLLAFAKYKINNKSNDKNITPEPSIQDDFNVPIYIKYLFVFLIVAVIGVILFLLL